MSSVTVSARVSRNVSCRLAVSTSPLMTSPVYSPSVSAAFGVAKMTCSGLAANTTYHCAVEVAGVLNRSLIGTFKTPAAGAHTFKIAFSSCADDNSNHVVHDRIRTEAPLFFMHLGDIHYRDIAANNPVLFRSAFDQVQRQARPAQLMRQIPTLYMYDDHDFGPNDSWSGSASRDAAVRVYRQRVPAPPLVETGDTAATYYSFEIGRVLFIVTDLRSMASQKSDSDTASKTKMGAAQKAWFKNLLSTATGKIICWFSTSPFIPNTTAGADHWGGYHTERVEIANHIKANCLGRIFILTGDTHAVGLDDGTNGDFATGGGGAVREFTASPLDRTTGTWPATYTSGYIQNRGQFGLVEFVDTGGATITVNWTAMLHDGTVLATQSFTRTP
jgi:phosphodiesterase/alkaline phosphatase D-like protein